MKILIPMAGEGRRFQEAGYKTNKAILPMIYRKTGERCPMVVCSVKDLPGIQEDGGNIAFIMRDFHMDMGIDEEIRRWYPAAAFFSVRELTEGLPICRGCFTGKYPVKPPKEDIRGDYER